MIMFETQEELLDFIGEAHARGADVDVKINIDIESETIIIIDDGVIPPPEDPGDPLPPEDPGDDDETVYPGDMILMKVERGAREDHDDHDEPEDDDDKNYAVVWYQSGEKANGTPILSKAHLGNSIWKIPNGTIVGVSVHNKVVDSNINFYKNFARRLYAVPNMEGVLKGPNGEDLYLDRGDLSAK